MSTDELTLLDEIVDAAAHGLFETVGLPLGQVREASGRTLQDDDVASSIGFTAPTLHGAATLVTRRDIVARSWPAELGQPSDRDVCDWAGELVNQLLGRVKNALVTRGVVLDQSTPTVVVGRQVHRSPASTTVARTFLYDVSGGGTIQLYFDAVVAEGFSLSPSAEGDPPAAEGALRLF